MCPLPRSPPPPVGRSRVNDGGISARTASRRSPERAGRPHGRLCPAVRELGDDTRRRDPPDATDHVMLTLREPEVAVRTRSDAHQVGVGADAAGEHRDHSRWGDPPDALLRTVGEPHVPIRTRGDAARLGMVARPEARGELGDHPRPGDPPDPTAYGLGEPHVPVRAWGDARRLCHCRTSRMRRR